MKKTRETIYLIDGNSLCYRAFYAIQELSTSKGFPTNAIYGVINMLRKIVKDYSPGMMAFVFDSKGPTERHEKYEDYKIHRKPMPDDLITQFPEIKDVIAAHNIPIYELVGYEADDIIATLAEKAVENGTDVVVVTSDKDALQLITKGIKVLSPQPRDDKVYTKDEVLEKYGVGPGEMVDLMGLMGDASDNVPGVKGVGKVTAAKLIKEYGSIDNVYKNIESVQPEGLRKKLIEEEDMARLSRELVELNRKVPVQFAIAKTKMGKPDSERLAELYRKYEFGRLLKELTGSGEAPKEKKASGKASYTSPGSSKDVDSLVKKIKKAGKTAFYIAGEDGVAFSLKEAEGAFISHKEKSVIRDIFEDEKIEKIGHDIKEDILALRAAGIGMKGVSFDVMIADYLLDPSLSTYSLSSVADRQLEYSLPEEGANWDESGQGTMELTASVDTDRACERSDVIFRLYKKLAPELSDKKLKKLFEEVEMPLVGIIADMEEEGVGIDIPELEKLSEKMEKKLAGVTKKIYKMAGEEFNINSPKQLQVILFEKIGLKPVKRTKTGASTDESVLTKLAGEHELPAMLLEYRAMNKLKTAYYDSIASLVNRKTGRLHAKFNQAVTATGRFSSSGPNLQNIPIKTEMGREIRKIFIPGGKGEELLAADYSQIELRILAHLSEDKKLGEAFKKGEDVHKFTASLIFDCEITEVTDEMRSAAKTVNFGITYGMGPFSLAKDLGISVREAQSFIDSYFRRYSGIEKFINKTIADARKKGYVTTLLNRRRYIPEIKSPNERMKSFAERVAVNTPMQGSAADIIKLAMIECHKELEDTGAKMLIQVHDELVFSVPAGKMKDVAKKVKKAMEGVIELKVPLKVDIEAGKNWYDMKEAG